MASDAGNTKLVYVLPWLTLSTGQYRVNRIPIGPAVFCPDDDETWREVVGKPRPNYLDIFRWFGSAVDEGREPEIARGTVLVAGDDGWLEGNVQLLVPFIYVLGQPADRWRTPAERFRYFGFRASDKPPEMVSFITKKGEMWEDRRSFKLFPPLELRGAHSPYRVDIHEKRNKAFVLRFEANPNDRLVVAARHLFRTQFADVFNSPWDQDYSTYCTCLEAALNIGEEADDEEEPEEASAGAEASGAVGGDGVTAEKKKPPHLRDIGKVLARRLSEKYIDLKDMPDWIEGLYACRVIFVHGLSGDASLRERQRKLRDAFLARRGNHLVLRNFCIDLIREQLDTAESELGRLLNQLLDSEGIHHLLECFFNSDHLWHSLKSHLAVDKAADKVLADNQEQRSDFFTACLRYVHDHRWHFMQEQPPEEQVFRVLITLALLLSKSKKLDQGEMQVVDELGRATAAKDTAAIGAWAAKHTAWEGDFDASDWVKIYKSVLAHTAKVFRTN